MLLTALPPAPPTPSTVIRGLSSVTSGALKLIVMSCLRELAPKFHVFRLTPRGRPSCFVSSAFSSQHSHSPEQTRRQPMCKTAPFHLHLGGRIWIVHLRRSRRRRDQESQRRRIGRSRGGGGDPLERLRPSDAHLLARHPRG